MICLNLENFVGSNADHTNILFHKNQNLQNLHWFFIQNFTNIQILLRFKNVTLMCSYVKMGEPSKNFIKNNRRAELNVVSRNVIQSKEKKIEY